MNEPPNPFPVTRWTWVDEAGQPDEELRLAALEAFLRLYRPALLAYMRRQFRLLPEDAEDCVQDFIVDKVIRQGLLSRADRERGRFRTFLCQAMNRFVIDRLRKEQARMRAPNHATVPLESLSEIELHRSVEAGDRDFDDAFFREAVHESLRRMQRRCVETNREVLWSLLQNRVLNQAFESGQPVPYDRLLPLLHLDSPDQAANLLTTAKRMFARTLRSVLHDYAATEDELNGELRLLERVLESAPGGSSS